MACFVYLVIFIFAAHSFLANEKIRMFLARPELLVNDILSLKTSGSGDEKELRVILFGQ